MQKLQTKTLLIITAVLCLLVFVSVGALVIFGSDETEIQTETSYTYYFNSGTTVYDSYTEITCNDGSLSIDGQVFDGIPLYYEEGLLLTNDMVFYPMINYDTYKVEALTTLEIDGENIKMSYNDSETSYSRGFLYDGKEVYVFLEKVRLYINDTEVVVPPLSYLYYDGFIVSYYNSESKEGKTALLEKESVMAENDLMRLYIDEEMVEDENTCQLIYTDIQSLDSLFAR